MRNKEIALIGLGAAMTRPEPRTEYVTQTIIEKRAPTDDSIRLAKEYEEKIWDSVSDRIVQDIKEINAQFVYMEKCAFDKSKRILFTVNGHKVDIRMPDDDDGNRYVVMKEMADNISAEIMTQIFKVGNKYSD